MHGCSSASVLIVNAEVDSMGEVVEGGFGIANRTSPRIAAIEKVQQELRQEYDVREIRKRELEFLEKGGNPLELKLGTPSSVGVQSTSFTDQHPDQFVTSEAKGSFAFTASPHGDSVESSGRPGQPPSEPNTADNLMLFDAENESSEGDRNLLHPGRSKVVSSEQSSQMDGSHKIGELGDSAALSLPRKAYRRRYRSRTNRDGARSNSTDMNPTRGSDGSSLPSRYGPRDVKKLVSDAENRNISLNWNSKPTSPVDGTLKTLDSQHDMDLDGLKSVESTKDLVRGVSIDPASDAIASEYPLDEQLHQQSLSGAAKTPTQMDFNGHEEIQPMEKMESGAIECQPSETDAKAENQFTSCQINGFSGKKGDGVKNDTHNNSASRGMKDLDSEPSCNQTGPSIDGNNDDKLCTRIGNVDSNRNVKDQSLVPDVSPVVESDNFVEEKKDTEGIDTSTSVNKEITSACQSERDNGFALPEEELNRTVTATKDQVIIEEMEASGPTGAESGRKPTDPLGVYPNPQSEISCDVKNQDSINNPIMDLPETQSLARVPTVSVAAQISSGSDLKLATKIDEDSILKEAEIIEAKRKRIAELSIATSPTEIRRKSHWDYVLEEMAWLANDFAQERIWKIAAAAQISYRVAFSCRLRKQEKCSGIDAKKVAHTLAKSVMEFWLSVEAQIQETSKELEQHRRKDGTFSVQAYAVRFLKYNKPKIFHNQAQVPLTPDRVSDSGILDLSWEDNLTEENLFYTVPRGSMETYRKSIESHVAQCERIGSCMQEEVETSASDAAADLESQCNAFAEDEGEASMYNLSPSFGQKKRKYSTHAFGSRACETGSDLLPMHCAENKVVIQQSALLAKRPGSSLNGSIPTKRVRTASRRVIMPFNGGASGCIQVPNKTDASSGDTNSFQDDQSTLRGGLLLPNSVEVDSVGDVEKQLPFDSAEVSTKPKKKKKGKHMNAGYEHRWQGDSSFHNEQFQRDNFKKRPESHQLESNGNSGLLGQPIPKKPKIMRQSLDNSFDNIPPSGGSVPSPVASQMSNMSNPNKFIKMLGGRDRGRKAKTQKMPSGQPGSGSPWSLFEDQALVVLAHDLGPNWELVSDAINSTLHFKCIFRKAKECKERHNFLMDRTSGDGADSAEDSGSSQPYPSTLPGIPKGSARQLFQRLQGPMEEDTLKSHFEKIITIGHKQLYRKTQNDHQEPKKLQQPHSSFAVALSQVYPNNLNGGPILTPLDLCDATIPGSDILAFGCQEPHSSGLANQGILPPGLHASGSSSALQGSPNMTIGNNFPSSPGPLNSPVSRDGRYMVPRSSPLSADEQQRIQQYNQMIPGRNIPPPNNISASGALPGTDRGVRIVPGGNGMGVVSGVNRSFPMARPGFQGIASSNLAGSPGISSPNVHSGRPREALHMMRPEFQMPGNIQGGSHFNALGSPPVSSYPVHHPISPHFQGQAANHNGPPPNPQQQQAYTIRLAKERQLRLQQQQQQQQQFSQLPTSISSPMQNSPQVVQPQTTSSPLQSGVGIVRNTVSGGSSGLTNQTGKQRQRQQQQQQFSQANNNRQQQHPQQRQQQFSQAKVAKKTIGRGNAMTNQNNNIPIDSSHLLNGPSTNPCPDKGEPHLTQPTRQYVAAPAQQKMYPPQAPSSSKHTHTDNSGQQGPALAGPNQQHQHHHAPPQQKSVNQNQPALQRVVQPNTDQLNPTSEMDTMKTNISASERLLDSNALNSATPNSSEPVLEVGPRPSSATSPPNRPDVSAQWQQNQQQPQLLQAGNGDLYGRSSDPRLE